MQPRLAIIILLCGLGLAGCQPGGRAGLPPNGPARLAGLEGGLGNGTMRLDEREALSLVSTYRRGHGLPALAYDPALMARAEALAASMARSGHLLHAHQAAPGSLVDVAAGHDTLEDAFSGWRYAPASRAHMLDRNMHRFAMAAVYAPHSRYRVFWAMIMAR
ncbi:MAG: CAP domain-containing protein [Hyphomicrobiales bacterium]|nr:CAP domain-containing protein [Hyphomicrobiales bacterium]